MNRTRLSLSLALIALAGAFIGLPVWHSQSSFAAGPGGGVRGPAQAIPISQYVYPNKTPRDDSISEKMGWKLGTQAYTFRSLTAFEMLEVLQKLGLKYVELYPNQQLMPTPPATQPASGASAPNPAAGPGGAPAAIPGGPGGRRGRGGGARGPTVNQNLTDEQIALLKAKLKETGVKAVSWGEVQTSTDEAAMRRIFEFARKMELETIMCEPPLATTLPLMDRLAQEYKIGLVLHNHPAPPYQNPDASDASLKASSQWVRLSADVGHWSTAGFVPLDQLKRFEGRMAELHFKDHLIQGGGATGRGVDVPWGQGSLNSRALLDELARQKFKGYVLLEYETGSGQDLVNNVSKCIEWFDVNVKEIAARMN